MKTLITENNFPKKKEKYTCCGYPTAVGGHQPHCPILKEPQKGKEDLRKEISKILVKWNMPTRQIAINEIVELISAAEQKGRKEERKEIVEEEQKKMRELVESFLGHRPDRSTP